MEIIAYCGIAFLVGFVSAYGFDAWLQYRDNKKWE